MSVTDQLSAIPLSTLDWWVTKEVDSISKITLQIPPLTKGDWQVHTGLTLGEDLIDQYVRAETKSVGGSQTFGVQTYIGDSLPVGTHPLWSQMVVFPKGETHPKLPTGPRIELTREVRFEYSHILPWHPGKCSQLHGHSGVMTVTVDPPIDHDLGIGMDYGVLGQFCTRVIHDTFDHSHLNDLHWFKSNTTAENILLVSWGLLEAAGLKWLKRLSFKETSKSLAVLTREMAQATMVWAYNKNAGGVQMIPGGSR